MASIPTITLRPDPLYPKFVAMCLKCPTIKQEALALMDENKLVEIKTNSDSSFSWCFTHYGMDLIYKASGV